MVSAAFFELRDLARKQEEEQRKREAKVFKPSSKVRSHDGITIPEPFALSRGTKDSQSHHDSLPYPDECTFAPQTNESENQKLLRRIMGSENPIPDLPDFSLDAWGAERRAPLWPTRLSGDSGSLGDCGSERIGSKDSLSASAFVELTSSGHENVDVSGRRLHDMVPERCDDMNVDARMASLLARMSETVPEQTLWHGER